MAPRPLRIFFSDVHLTDQLAGTRLPWEQVLERFWARIQGARGEQPAELVIVGDFLDLIRSTAWFDGEHRPYHSPGPGMLSVVDTIVDGVLEREQAFFAALRSLVESEQLRVHYLLGNHDRLLAHAPAARRRLWAAMTGEVLEAELPEQLVFEDDGVLAYHGHVVDLFSTPLLGLPPVADAIALELVVRLPMLLKERLELDDPHLDEIDDVRPIFAVPAWVRQLGQHRKGLVRPLLSTWQELVEGFLDIPFVDDWLRAQKKVKGFNPGKQLKLLLQLSTAKVLPKTRDKHMTDLYKAFAHVLDGRFAAEAAQRLQDPDHAGLRYVINGHSHFPSMTPLGVLDAGPATYFNTGTWKPVHQMGTHTPGRPSFLHYDAMSYVAFFPDDDPLGRDVEWWTGASLAR